MKIKILDYIDQKLLQQIQDQFSDATGLAAIAVDAEGKYITEGSNFTDFCMKYTRNTPLGKQRCEKCDAECTGTYFCHAGLMDFSHDILINGEKVGAIIGGQVLPEAPDPDKFRRIAKELGVPEDKYINALNKVPIKNEKSIRAAADLLGQIVNMLVNLEYMKSTDRAKITLLDEEMKDAFKNSENISAKAGMLAGIASKQNMLALNATIEAARSGQAGAGFSVVAKEMSELSKSSAEIYEHIRKDSEALHSSVSKMNELFRQQS